jgi:hypothetical protein
VPSAASSAASRSAISRIARPAPGRRHQRPGRLGDPTGEPRRRRLADAAGHPQRRLPGEVERALPAFAARILQPEGVDEVRKIASDRQRRRQEDPGPPGPGPMPPEGRRDRQRRTAQAGVRPAAVGPHDGRIVRPVDPADVDRRVFRGRIEGIVVSVTRRRTRRYLVECRDPTLESLAQLGRTKPAAIELRTTTRIVGDDGRDRHQIGLQFVERIRQAGQCTELLAAPAARGRRAVRRSSRHAATSRYGRRGGTTVEGESQLPTAALQPIGERTPVGAVTCLDQSRADQVAGQLDQLARRHRLAEKLGRGIGKLVRFVEDHRIRSGKQLADRVLAQGQIGAEQVMVHDHDVGGQRLAPRTKHEAPLDVRAFLPEAVVTGRGRMDPCGVFFGQAGALGPVAGRAGLGEHPDASERCRDFRIGKAAVDELPLEMMVADVVGATLEQCRTDVQPERRAHCRKISGMKLVLEVAGPGRHQYLAARQQQRRQVGEGLAGARAGLRDQRAPFGDCACDADRERLLTLPGSETGHRAHEGAALAEGGRRGLLEFGAAGFGRRRAALRHTAMLMPERPASAASGAARSRP